MAAQTVRGARHHMVLRLALNAGDADGRAVTFLFHQDSYYELLAIVKIS
jgi:hypothetical protein